VTAAALLRAPDREALARVLEIALPLRYSANIAGTNRPLHDADAILAAMQEGR
jgi:hypothetical protein